MFNARGYNMKTGKGVEQLKKELLRQFLLGEGNVLSFFYYRLTIHMTGPD
jgi:hypothetical protein